MLQWRRQAARCASPQRLFNGRPSLLIDPNIKIKPLHLTRTSETASKKLPFQKLSTFLMFELVLVGFFVSVWAVEALAHHAAQWALVVLCVHHIIQYSLSNKQQHAASFHQPTCSDESHPPDVPPQKNKQNSKTPLEILTMFIVTATGLAGLCFSLKAVHVLAGYCTLLAFAVQCIHNVAVAPYLHKQQGPVENEKGKPAHNRDPPSPCQEQPNQTSQVRIPLLQNQL
jgi:hypothetical protein